MCRLRFWTLLAAVLMSTAGCSSQPAPQAPPAPSPSLPLPEGEAVNKVTASGHPALYPPNEGHDIADGTASKVPGVEGTYCTALEIAAFSGTVLELKEGKFRYWFYSDASGGQEPKYPVTGAYLIQDGRLTLDHA